MMKGTFNFIFKATGFLIKGYTLKKETGARFANKDEEKNFLNARHTGLLIDGKNNHLSEKDSFEHMAIIAKPGTGKTTSFIIPNILDKARQNCSMVVTDPSGEIFNQTSAYMQSKGFKILTLNPDDLAVSSKFNPFDGLGASNIIEIEQVCSSIILSKYANDKDPVWNEGAISILEVLSKCLAYTYPDFLNLPNLNYLVNLFGEKGQALDAWVAKSSMNPLDPTDLSVVYMWQGLTQSNKNMLSSYGAIAKTALKQLNNPELQGLLAKNDIDFLSFRKQKTIMYLIIPAHQQQYYQFIIDLFYSRFFNIMMKALPQKRDLSIYCLMDEFGSSYVHGFAELINNIRKYRVSLSIVFQSIAQLRAKYGDSAEAVKGGIGSYLVFSGADYTTAKEMSDIIGKRVMVSRNKFTDVQEKVQELDLLSAGAIRTLENNECLFLSKNRHPILIKATPFYKNNHFHRATKKGAIEQVRNNERVQVKFVDV